MVLKVRKKIFDTFQNSIGISTDTRSLEQGQLFFAIKGDNFDGNKYAEQAIDNGAVASVIDDESFFVDNGKYILVNDVLSALQELSMDYRDTFDIPVIGITGSNGKTTTKELVNIVLSQKYKVHCTSGNFNNHLGVPLTLLSAPADSDILIVEMGANFAGEIHELCLLSKPTIGIITNISSAHMEGFGTMETIVETKTALYRYLIENGKIFVNENNKQLLELALNNKDITLYNPETMLEFVKAEPNITWKYTNTNDSIEFDTQLVGKYNMDNISVAIAIGQYMDINIQSILNAISSYQPNNNRSQLKELGTNKYILDAYNANPSSMKNSILSLVDIEDANKILILGDMLELGDIEAFAHQELVDFVNMYKWKKVFLIGPRFESSIIPDDYFCFNNVQGLKEHLDKHPLDNSIVLLKGSRGIALEKILL